MFDFNRHDYARTKTSLGLLALLATPAIALGQLSEVSQLSYWEHDVETQTNLPLQMDSRVFRVELGFDPVNPASEQLLAANGGAYVNLVVVLDAAMGMEWVVRNAYESVPDASWFELGNIAYEFGSAAVPNGVSLDSCIVAVVLTDEPIGNNEGDDEEDPGDADEVLDAVDPDQVRVELVQIHLDDIVYIPFSEEDLEEYDADPEWEEAGYRVEPGKKPVEDGQIATAPTDIPAIDEKSNHCVPGAHARSISYLMTYHDFTLVGDATPQDLFERFADAMDTTDALGTYPNEALEGRRTVLSELAPSTIRSNRCQDMEGDSEEEFAAAASDAMSRLKHGHDVEITLRIKRTSATATRPATFQNHRATLVRVAKYEHVEDPTTFRYRITTMDDQQGDDTAENEVNEYIANEAGQLYREVDGALHYYGYVVRFGWDEYIPRLCDLTNNGIVDGADLGFFLGNWGDSPDGSETDGDLNGDGKTNGADMSFLLGNWQERFDH